MRYIKPRRERGAALVEFAVLMPLLVLLLLGIVEFGWLLSQHLDVRHGAREGARLSAVNYPAGPNFATGLRNDTDRDALIAEICDRMDTASSVSVTLTSAGAVADPSTVKVSAPASSLTGFLSWAIPSSLNLVSEVEIRLEQNATWSNTVAPPPGQACP